MLQKPTPETKAVAEGTTLSEQTDQRQVLANQIPAGNQHLEGGGCVAKGKDQSWLLECTHHASDRQVGSRCNGDKLIPAGKY